MNNLNAVLAGYLPLWREGLHWHRGEGQSALAGYPSYITHIVLSFLRPDGIYDGDLSQSTLNAFERLDIPFTLLKQEIAASRKQGGPGRKILASVGGETAGNFPIVYFDQLAHLIADLDLDGIDIDYEPNGVMTRNDEEVAKYISLITGFRKALDAQSEKTGKKYLLTCAPTGVGALGNANEYRSLGIEDEELLVWDRDSVVSDSFSEIRNRLETVASGKLSPEELILGTPGDSGTLTQSEKYPVGTACSAWDFDSAGKMARVLLAPNRDSELPHSLVGQMVDLVIFQGYNMGTANVLGKILCYESYRALSEYLNRDKAGSGFAVIHGSHVGKEAWPHFSYTKERLAAIYGYIYKYGRPGDGASFWSLIQEWMDDSANVPPGGTGFSSCDEYFQFTGSLLGLEDIEKPLTA